MERNKVAEAMLIWLRPNEPDTRTERVLVWIGYAVFSFLALVFSVIAGVAIFLLVNPAIEGSEKWLAAALVMMGAGGVSFSVWRLRKHVRIHGKKGTSAGERANGTTVVHIAEKGFGRE